METLAKKLQGKVQFAFIYAQEIHPNTDINALPGSPVDSIPLLTPTHNRAERQQRASEFRRLMKGSVRRMLVDEDEGGEEGYTRVQCLYHNKNSGARNFIIDRNRHVVEIGKVDFLYQRLPQLFPDLASDLRRDDANPHSADLPAEE